MIYPTVPYLSCSFIIICIYLVYSWYYVYKSYNYYHIHIYIYTYMYIYMYIYIYVYIYMYICIYIYIYKYIFVYSIHIWFWRNDYNKVRFLEIVGPPLIRFIFSIFSWLNTIFGWTCWTPGSWHLASQEKTINSLVPLGVFSCCSIPNVSCT